MATTATKQKPKAKTATAKSSAKKTTASSSRNVSKSSRAASTPSTKASTASKPASRKASSTKSSSSKSTSMKGSDKLNASQRKSLRSYDYGLPDKKEFPMPDAQHVHAAESYFRYASTADKPQLARRIMTKAKKYGVDIQSENIREWSKK